MIKQCCCGQYDLDEPLDVNGKIHEPIGTAGAFCGPASAHHIRDLRAQLATALADKERMARELEGSNNVLMQNCTRGQELKAQLATALAENELTSTRVEELEDALLQECREKATALAERDAARERVGELEQVRDYYKSCAEANTNEAATLIHNIGAILGMVPFTPWSQVAEAVKSAVQERDQIKRERDEAKEAYTAVCQQAKDAENAIGKAYRQGFEDCREAAVKKCEWYEEDSRTRLGDTKAAACAYLIGAELRVLPVLERGKVDGRAGHNSRICRVGETQ